MNERKIKIEKERQNHREKGVRKGKQISEGSGYDEGAKSIWNINCIKVWKTVSVEKEKEHKKMHKASLRKI